MLDIRSSLCNAAKASIKGRGSLVVDTMTYNSLIIDLEFGSVDYRG